MLSPESKWSIILVLFALSSSALGDQVVIRCNWQQPIFGRNVANTNRMTQVVPDEMVNDGYCDCPGGEDEFLTSACSGVALWAGSVSDESNNDEDDGSAEHFSCRIEDVSIHLSHVNDGICDCCDGSDEVVDEYGSHNCPDTCHGILQKRRQEQTERNEKFEKGFAQRKNDIAAYEEARLALEAKLDGILLQLEPLRKELVDATERLSEERALEEEDQKQELSRTVLNIGSVLGVNTMNDSELEDLIVSACYLSGSYIGLQEAGSALYQSAFSQAAESIEGDYSYWEAAAHFDDEFDEEFDNHPQKEAVQNANGEDTNPAAIATSRSAFKIHASKLLENSNASSSSPDSQIELVRRLDQIKDAESAAAHARKLILELLSGDEHVDLVKVSVLTTWYGKIGSADFYEILHSVLPEFRAAIPESKISASANIIEDHAVHASVCPPQSTVRMNENKPTVIPPDFVTRAVDARCKQRSAIGGTDGIVKNMATPTEIPDGYFGYFEFAQRSLDDDIITLFMPVEEPKIKGENVSRLENEVSAVSKKVENLEKEERDANNEKVESPELFAFRNHECLEMDSGSYTYSICPGKRAAQHDIGASKGDRGTGLGTWEGFTRDEATGVLIMNFTNGLKCWNGPNRSATVIVSCGDSHKLLTAIEPETCRYEFTMESTIACDDAYRIRYGL